MIVASPAQRLVAATVVTTALAVGQAPPPFPVRDGMTQALALFETRSPFGFAGFALGTTSAELYFALGDTVYRRAANGLVHVIRTLPNFQRPGLLTHPRGTATLYYTEYATGRLFVRDLASGTEQQRAGLPNTYDLVVTASGAVLVTANPSWPAPGSRTGVWLLDPIGTAHRELIRISGPSGPLAIDPRNGDLLYATQSAIHPPPPGSTQILRFPAARVAAAIAGGPVLGAADAQVAPFTLDGAFGLEFDDRGRMYVSDPQHGGVRRIRADSSLDPLPFAARTGRGTLGLAFAAGGPASFDAWQPPGGGGLWVGEADWATFAAVREITAERPTLERPGGATVSPGPFRIQAAGLPGHGAATLLVSPLPASSERLLLHHQGIPLWTALDLSFVPITVGVTIDAAGHGRLDLVHPGGFAMPLTVQALTLPAAPDLGIALSNTLALRLTQ